METARRRKHVVGLVGLEKCLVEQILSVIRMQFFHRFIEQNYASPDRHTQPQSGCLLHSTLINTTIINYAPNSKTERQRQRGKDISGVHSTRFNVEAFAHLVCAVGHAHLDLGYCTYNRGRLLWKIGYTGKTAHKLRTRKEQQRKCP